MKSFKFIVFFSLVLAFSTVLAAAQETGGLKGKVRTIKGDGIAAANVTVRQNGEDLKSVTADGNGNFVLENLKSGIYNLVFNKSGYSSGVLYNVEVKKKKTNDLGDRLILSVDQGTLVVIRGSVFAADGRSVAGAEIKIEKILSDGSTKKAGSSVSNYSGEFAFKFAEGAANYRITASAKGMSASKEVEVESAAIYRLAITLEGKDGKDEK
ncbi:MAG: carboxypeptidase-like regulatory domain-containing protein [Acidobacteriota bacterium]|nr:carboxypeptidase-like regulatory domain-containing protein [Acidobacteriota bacterium]